MTEVTDLIAMSSTPTPLPTGTVPPSVTTPPARRLIAPLWHTILLVVILVGVSWAGRNSQQTYSEGRGRIPFYVITMGGEWLLTAYVLWGASKRGIGVRELTGGRWAAPEDALLDVAIAVGFWIVALLVLAVIGLVLGAATGQLGGGAGGHAARMAQNCQQLKSIGFVAPQNGLQLLVFLGVAATAGFCEEIIFRGYLQRQFAGMSGIAALGVVGQALVFGAAHGYEGALRMIAIAAYGALFGLLVLWRRSLRPAMIAHALHDGVVGALIAPLTRLLKC